MASPNYNIPPPFFDHADTDPHPAHPHLVNDKTAVLAVFTLCCFIIFFTILYVYGKCHWNRNQEHAARNVGLSKAVIARLPTFTYNTPTIREPAAGAGAGGALLECAVCLREFQENEKGRLLPSCKHSFHIECIDMWFYSHSTCPLCRTLVMPLPITEIAHQGEEEAQFAIHTRPSANNNDPLYIAPTIADASFPANFSVRTASIVPLCGDDHSTQSPSPSSSSAKTTRCMPHIRIEIPTTLASPHSPSLLSGRSRCTSPHDISCSSRTSLKSPGLRASLNKMLSSQSSMSPKGT